MKDNNQVLQKSKAFAVRIVRLHQYLTEEKKEKVLAKQVLRSGTSIGANVKEAIRAQSTADFLSKLQIALKETSETEYWLELLADTDYLTDKAAESLLQDCRELIRLLTSIIKTCKENNQMTMYESTDYDTGLTL